MRARDANNATWYMLRYGEQFAVDSPDTFVDNHTPFMSATLFYDDERHVLELLPEPSTTPIAPLPGLAVDTGGEIYRSRPGIGTVMVHCGPHRWPLVCETQVFINPMGMALDRRGYLYVADPAARRVLVVLPDDGTLIAVLGPGCMVEPVDVAVTRTGIIYVADPGAGKLWFYNSRFVLLGSFEARNAEGLPAVPRPVAVMIEAAGTLLVADAGHPRLLRFSLAGEPLADVALTTATARLNVGPEVLDVLNDLYGSRALRFVPGNCCPTAGFRDGAERLVEIHRALRLLQLRLGRRFATNGTFISAGFDSGLPGMVWHRVLVEADLPDNTAITVETATSDNPDAPDLLSDDVWSAPRNRDGAPLPISAAVSDQLIQSAPGRFLWVRIRLGSTGDATPQLRSVRILYPRHSYLDLLPRVYRRDPDGAWFMERFLALFEAVFTGIENRYERFSNEINPDAAPLEVINWLACLVDLSFDPSWCLRRRRDLVNRAMDLYRRKGTPRGIADYIEIYTGTRPTIIEDFLLRPRETSFLGRPGNVLGCPLHLRAQTGDVRPEERILRDHAHRFSVLVYITDACDAETVLPVVARIVEVNKPAHTAHRLRAVHPDLRVGVQSTVGVDTVLGGRPAAGVRVTGCGTPQPSTEPGHILGSDSILGERRPHYIRPGDIRI